MGTKKGINPITLELELLVPINLYICDPILLGIELVPLSGAFLEPELVIINQPFVFLIRDIKEEVILFYGKVVNPVS